MKQNGIFLCRACGENKGSTILDFGLQPLANNLLTAGDLKEAEAKFPLRLALCQSCWLLQLMDRVPPVTLFSDSLDFSSFSDTILQHAKRSVDRYINEFQLHSEKFVVEIASNDGYLLQNFRAPEIRCLGIEPAAKVASVAQERGIETRVAFFGEALALELSKTKGKADLILANNVFDHVPDPNDFVRGLKRLLKPNGCAILEFPYARDIVEKTEFDTIYHEHVFYFSLSPLLPLFQRHNLSVYHVEHLEIHGGSLRIFIGHDPIHSVEPEVLSLLNEERSIGMHSVDYYRSFAQQVWRLKEELKELLFRLKGEGKRIAAYGASAEGSTLLNVLGLGKETLDFVVDQNTHKHARFFPGTHVPIVKPSALREQKPDYTLLLARNFVKEILEQEKEYCEAGGKFIIPIPAVQVI